MHPDANQIQELADLGVAHISGCRLRSVELPHDDVEGGIRRTQEQVSKFISSEIRRRRSEREALEQRVPSQLSDPGYGSPRPLSSGHRRLDRRSRRGTGALQSLCRQAPGIAALVADNKYSLAPSSGLLIRVNKSCADSLPGRIGFRAPAEAIGRKFICAQSYFFDVDEAGRATKVIKCLQRNQDIRQFVSLARLVSSFRRIPFGHRSVVIAL